MTYSNSSGKIGVGGAALAGILDACRRGRPGPLNGIQEVDGSIADSLEARLLKHVHLSPPIRRASAGGSGELGFLTAYSAGGARRAERAA